MKTSRAELAILATTLMVGGCTVNEAAEVATYREPLDRGIDTAATFVDVSKPLDVVESMRLASIRSEQLAIEGESYLQAIINQRRAAAAFLPTIALAPSYSFRDDTSTGNDSGLDMPVEGDLFFNPVSDAATIRFAKATAKERLSLLLAAQDTLLLDVARAHYEVLRAERDVEVLESSLAVQQERMAEAEAKLEAGLVRPLDLSLSQAQVSQTAVALNAARRNARNARLALSFLTHESMDARVLDDSIILPESMPDAETLIQRGLEGRQELLASAHRIEAARQAVESAYGQYYPSVALNIQVFLQKDSTPTDLDWSSLIRVSLPLFSAGVIEADVRESLSILRQAVYEDSQLRRAVERDIQVARQNLLTAVEQVRQLQVQVKSAAEALEQAVALYDVGMATNLERLEAQERLLSSQLQLVNAELDAKVFHLDVQRTTGSLHKLIGLERSPAPKRLTHAETR